MFSFAQWIGTSYDEWHSILAKGSAPVLEPTCWKYVYGICFGSLVRFVVSTLYVILRLCIECPPWSDLVFWLQAYSLHTLQKEDCLVLDLGPFLNWNWWRMGFLVQQKLTIQMSSCVLNRNRKSLCGTVQWILQNLFYHPKIIMYNLFTYVCLKNPTLWIIQLFSQNHAVTGTLQDSSLGVSGLHRNQKAAWGHVWTPILPACYEKGLLFGSFQCPEVR